MTVLAATKWLEDRRRAMSEIELVAQNDRLRERLREQRAQADTRIAELQAENADLRAKYTEAIAMLGKASIAIQLAVAWADATHAHWSRDRDAKVGKYLAALSGHLQGYAPDTDGIHAYAREVREFVESARAAGGEK